VKETDCRASQEIIEEFQCFIIWVQPVHKLIYRPTSYFSEKILRNVLSQLFRNSSRERNRRRPCNSGQDEFFS